MQEKFLEEYRQYKDLCSKSLGPAVTRLIQTSRDLAFSLIASQHGTYLGEMNLPFSIYNALYYTLMAPLQNGKLIVGEHCENDNNVRIACYAVAGVGYILIASSIGAGVLIGTGAAFGLQDGTRMLMNLLPSPLALQLLSKHSQNVMLGLDKEISFFCFSLDGSHVSSLTTLLGSAVSVVGLWGGIKRFELPMFAYAMMAGTAVKIIPDLLFHKYSGRVFHRPEAARVRRDLWKIMKRGAAPALQTATELATYLFALPWWAYQQGPKASSILQVATGVIDSFAGSIVNAIPVGTTRQITGKRDDLRQLKAIGNRGVSLTAFLSGIFLTVFLAMPRILMGLFTNDEETLQLSETVMRLVCTGQALYNVRYTQETVLRMGYKDTTFALAMSILCTGILMAVCFPLKRSLSFDSAIFVGMMGLNLAMITLRYLQRTNGFTFWSSPADERSLVNAVVVNDEERAELGNKEPDFNL